MQKIDGHRVNLKIEQSMIDEIDRIAGRLGNKRNDMIRNLLDVALFIYSGYEKSGVIKAFEWSEGIKKRLKKFIGNDTLPILKKNL